MTTSVGSAEAARMLGVSQATLYAYVSRGRIARTAGPDGRTSLFARDEVEALAARSGRAAPGPPPTIDVRVASTITRLHEDSVVVRGHDLPEVVATRGFEDIAELVWSGALGHGTTWPAAERGDRDALAGLPDVDPISRLAIAAHVLADLHPGDDAATAARRLLLCAPPVLGSRRVGGPYARRLAGAWAAKPTDELVDAVDTALGLLADHELASSTLAVRVAASVRSSPYLSIAAGLSVVAGPLHGRAAAEAHHFIAACVAEGVAKTVASIRSAGERVPGFGHKVYRGPDPRFGVMIDAVRRLGDLSIVDDITAEVGRVIPKHPNIDLALGALSWRARLPADVPIFAVARIAGWGAHHAEELDAPPVRFRGVTT